MTEDEAKTMAAARRRESALAMYLHDHPGANPASPETKAAAYAARIRIEEASAAWNGERLPDGAKRNYIAERSAREAVASLRVDLDAVKAEADDEAAAELRETITAAAARALFVTSYADACEWADDDPDGMGAAFVDDYADRDDRAGPGEDWTDTTAHHETPHAATVTARGIVSEFERANARSIVDAFDHWATFDRYGEPDTVRADRFGHALAMQWLGHGVGLWDDVRSEPADRVGFAVGLGEFGPWEFDAPPRD